MTPQQAKTIIDALANGTDPETGEVLPAESVFNHPQVIRALFTASHALVQGSKRQSEKVPPENAGKPWSAEEDEAVAAAFNEGVPVNEIAARHGRTRGSINSRLIRLGCIVERSDADRVARS